MDVLIPDIGDAEDVEVIEICVGVGDAVGENDALIVIESDKASMEVPAPFAGTVSEVLVALGDHVNAGDPIMRVAADEAVAPPPPEAMPTPAVAVTETVIADEPAAGRAPAVGPAAPAVAPRAVDGVGTKVYAGPAVRRLARELGVDLTAVPGTGANGRIVKDDVKLFVKKVLNAPRTGPGLAPMPEIDFSRFGEIDTVPLSRIRARGAANLHRSWQHVVHVTQHDEADVTDLEAFRAGVRDEASGLGIKLTPLPFIVKACVHVLKRHPPFNASLDATVTALILKRYYNIGMAVDTDDGLVVPVIRNADVLGIYELAEESTRLAAAAREGKLKPDEIQGASFTVSSLGAIGGTGFTPVVNAPEVAILGVARLATRPVWDGTAFRPRELLPLSLSYDHRAINGAEAGRFVSDLVATLGDIRRLAL
ncbi:MAG: 2-oxo acid dehydrogenase subunit E2 [Gammaproteobacteria bacterium]|nr:2-oxo acid dehydrogenase subunit E2 [Gammaproteobacteria bacterium]